MVQLTTSTSLQGFGDVRSLLHTPCEGSWAKLVESVEMCDPDSFSNMWLPYMLDMLGTTPWQSIARTIPKGWLRALAAGEPMPWMRLCNTMNIHFKPKPYNRIFSALKSQPWLLDGLRALHLSGELHTANLEMIMGIHPRFRLQTLRVDSSEVSDEALSHILQMPITQGLHALICKGSQIHQKSVRIIRQAEHLNGLTHLVMCGVALTPTHFAEVLRAPSASQWRHLDLSSRRPAYASLHCHHLIEHNHLHDEGLHLLARARHVQQLRTLNMSHSNITHLGLLHLNRAEHLRSLHHLDLSHSHGLTDTVIELLLHNPMLHHLRSLNLSHCSLTHDGIALLNNSSKLPHLQHLNVTGNLCDVALREAG